MKVISFQDPHFPFTRDPRHTGASQRSGVPRDLELHRLDGCSVCSTPLKKGGNCEKKLENFSSKIFEVLKKC